MAIEGTRKQLEQAGIVKKREGDDAEYFSECIGRRSTWQEFMITPMQGVILDMLYDVGEKDNDAIVTVTPKDLLYDKTRVAHILMGKEWYIGHGTTGVYRHIHKETGDVGFHVRWYNRDKYETQKFDDDLRQELLREVDDKEVLADIRKAIRQMKTEARPWLYTPEEKGHYALNWWGKIERIKEKKGIREENEAMLGTVKNDWEFVKEGYRNFQWKPLYRLKLYSVTCDSRRIATFYTEADANNLLSQLKDNLVQMAYYYDVAEEYYEPHLKPTANPEVYPPWKYVKLHLENKLPTMYGKYIRGYISPVYESIMLDKKRPLKLLAEVKE